MTYLTVYEWGRIPVCATGSCGGARAFSRTQANALLAAARAHPLANQHGTNILIDRHSEIVAGQMVGVISAGGCSLEILPKLDQESIESDSAIRHRLVRMLGVALGLDISDGQAATMARQSDTLLDAIIRLFVDRLLAEARRGLPLAYLPQENDVPALRGRLDVKRQFSLLATRSDRLACRYDTLLADTALLRIMKACVIFLRRHARATETVKRLDELRLILADVSEVPLRKLPWNQVRIDRSNHRWGELYGLACLFLERKWQATHHDSRAPQGFTLLFPMNDLFEAYISVLAKKAFLGTEWTSDSQKGRLYWMVEERAGGEKLFQTKPDLLIKKGNDVALIIDTKWKCIGSHPNDAKRGVSQADIYQMMAYTRLYRCQEAMLLYPHHVGLGSTPLDAPYRVWNGEERLRIASVDLSTGETGVIRQLSQLFSIIKTPAS